jgi:hypothetical protein
MDFLQWCREGNRWSCHAWANDPKCRLPAGVPESPEAYAETFTAAGYGGYLYRLAVEERYTGASAWDEYRRFLAGLADGDTGGAGETGS